MICLFHKAKRLLKGIIVGLFDIFTYIGIIASAVSGALLGVKKRLDFFGIIVLGISTA
ncbi:MAG: TRIC cation channel family protein, partial [Candidatus Saccharibacteria bacterium]